MKKIFRIGRVELSELFYSPIAWLLLIIFAIQSALLFTNILDGDLTNQLLSGGHYTPGNLTSFLFSRDGVGLFSEMENNLYLYIPLLTMGLMSREYSGSGIKLLLSSPIKISDIVLGKFLAIIAYWTILMLIMALFIIAGYFSIIHMDWGLLLSGLLGIFLLACAYSAIGLFMSCLTSHQVVAAISTLVVLAALNYIGGLWQDIPVLKDIVNFLHLGGHTGYLLNGLIISRDVFYYLIIMILFLGLSVLALQDTIQARRLLIKAARYLLFIGVVLFAGHLTMLRSLTGYYDMTTNKDNTLTPASQAIIRQIKGPVKISAYVNLLDENVGMGMLSNRQHDLAFWENYIRFMPGIDLRYINYYDTVNNDYIFGNPVYRKMKLDSIAMRVAAGRNWDLDNFLSPVQIHKIINLAPEGNYFVRQIEYGNKATFLRMFHDVIQDPSEKEITTAFKRLIADPPVIAFLSGHNERSINKGGEKGYETFFSSLKERSSLINQGFDITTVFPDQKIPANIASLVIADPTTAFSPAEIQNIQNYLRGGGNALIAGDKDRQAILNPVVSMLGVRFTDGSLVENHMEFSPGLVFPKFTENVAMYHYFFENNQEIAMPGAVGLQYKKNDLYDIEPVLTTDEKNIWNKKAPFKLDTGKVAYEPSKGDDNRTLPVALQLTRKAGDKQQRIIILGDADFMDNGTVRKEFKGESTANGDFATDIFKWFSYGQFPLDLPRPAPIDNKLLLTPQGLYILKIIFLALLPGLLLLGGIVLLISRRRK